MAAVATLLANLISLLPVVIEALPACQQAVRGPVPQPGDFLPRPGGFSGKICKAPEPDALAGVVFRALTRSTFPSGLGAAPRSAEAVLFLTAEVMVIAHDDAAPMEPKTPKQKGT
jgi:hypothetical protein